ncbi:GAF and ANTAR domain-containing protein [Agromyces sp. ZXT2-6]|uniref:GAF and ANTAR domain-containing protein n=1 Tax=Agromyces sp. ZXT2-6 TaxID=3461153 RepID=UPI004054DA27
MSEAYRDSMQHLAGLEDEDGELTIAVLRAVPVSGAAVSTLGGLLGQETVASSDAIAARIDELQFDLGEGPCCDVVANGTPIFEPEIQTHPRHPWPAFIEAIRDEPVGALFAFPLSVGTMHLGALDLYHAQPLNLSDEHARQVAAMTEVISRYLLRRALRYAGDLEPPENRHARRIVHQATGFVIAQLGLPPEDAHLLIQGQALVQGRSMADVARDVVDRRLTFTRTRGRIEEKAP